MTSRKRTARVVGALSVVTLTVGAFVSTAGAAVPQSGVRPTADFDYDRTLRSYCESLYEDIDEATAIYNGATPREQKNLSVGLRRLVTEWNTYCSPIFSLTIVPPAR